MRQGRMRYYAIHSNGYSGTGSWAPAFEMEADSPSSHPTSVTALQRRGIAHDAGMDLEDDERLTALQLAVLTAPQHIGYLAQVDDGTVVADSKGLVDEEDRFHWQNLNIADDSDDPEGDFEELQEEWENTLAGGSGSLV